MMAKKKKEPPPKKKYSLTDMMKMAVNTKPLKKNKVDLFEPFEILEKKRNLLIGL